MKNLIKVLAVAGLMSSGLAQASVPADFSTTPGTLLVNWQASAVIDGKSNPMLEVRDESGDLLTSVHASLMGTQRVQLPSRTQGTLTVSLGNESSQYRVPFGLGDGRQR